MKVPRNWKNPELSYDLFGSPEVPLKGNLRVRKRDGYVESFSLQKLSESIKKAIQSEETRENELEYSLATAIKAYLRECSGLEAILTTEEIYLVTSQVLEEMGLKKALKAYTTHHRYKQFEREISHAGEEYKNLVADNLKEKVIGHELLAFENMEHIYETMDEILKPLALSKEIVERVIGEVVQVLKQLGAQNPSKGFLVELCQYILQKEGITFNYSERYLHLPMDRCVKVLTTNSGEEISPISTDYSLGRAVKREISRSYIFSAEIVDAHEEGIIYLHGLSEPDRFMNVQIPASHIWKMNKKENAGVRSPEDFWRWTSKIYHDWWDFFYSGISLWGFNWAIAPFIKGLEGSDYKDWLASFLEEYEDISSQIPEFELIFDWDLPQKWLETYALGPKGRNLGATYSDYSDVARQFMMDALEVLRSFGKRENKELCPIIWRFSLPMRDKPSPSFWANFVSCIEDLSLLLSLHFTSYKEMQMLPRMDAWGVTINLARIAYRSSSLENFYSEVLVALFRAKKACEEKLKFLAQVGGTPSKSIWKPLLSKLLRNSSESLPLNLYPITLYFSGIHEAMVLLDRESRYSSIELWDKAETILREIRGMVNFINHTWNMDLKMALETDIYILCSLAEKDTEDFPDLFTLLNRGQPSLSFPCYSFDIAPFPFHVPDELISQFQKVFPVGRLLDSPLSITLLPTCSLDGKRVEEIVSLFGRENRDCVPAEFIIVPFEY